MGSDLWVLVSLRDALIEKTGLSGKRFQIGGSQNCTCTLNSISFENKFVIFVLLEIGQLSTTKWFPLEEIETDLFFCDATQTHKISASYICDGLVHIVRRLKRMRPSQCAIPWRSGLKLSPQSLLNSLLQYAAACSSTEDNHGRKEIETNNRS